MRTRSRKPLDALTPRQREVVALMAKGHTNPEIATKLGMTIDGAKWHVREILSKLGAESREDAVRIWRGERHGLPRALLLSAGTAATAAALVAVGLGAWLAWPHHGSSPSPSTMRTAVPTVTGAPPASAIPTGRTITLDDAIARLPATEGQPEAAYDGKLIVMSSVSHFDEHASPQSTYDETFRLWDPATGRSTPLWTTMGSVDRDSIAAVDGDWAAVWGSHGDDGAIWTLRVRNLKTGEVHRVASVDDGTVGYYMLTDVAMDDGSVLFVTLTQDGPTGGSETATVTWTLHQFDIATGATSVLTQSAPRTVALNQNPTAPDGWAEPALTEIPQPRGDVTRLGPIAAGSGHIAWVETYENGDSVIELRNTAGDTRAIPGGQQVTGVAFAGSGDDLAGTDSSGTTVLDLATGVPRSIQSTAPRAPLYGSGDDISWWAGNSVAGFYNTVSGVISLVAQPDDTRTNVGQVMGDWFVWQIMPSDGSNPGYWAIVPLK